MSPKGQFMVNRAKSIQNLNQRRTIQFQASSQAKRGKTKGEIKATRTPGGGKVTPTGVKKQFSKPRFPFRSNKVHSFMPGPPQPGPPQ